MHAPLIEEWGQILLFCGWADWDGHMIRGGLLGEEDGHKVIALACEESAACRVTRRVNALVLLEDGRNSGESESTEDTEPYRANGQSRRQTMSNSHIDNTNQAVQ